MVEELKVAVAEEVVAGEGGEVLDGAFGRGGEEVRRRGGGGREGEAADLGLERQKVGGSCSVLVLEAAEEAANKAAKKSTVPPSSSSSSSSSFPTGVPSLDALLSPHPPSTVLEIYGPTTSGKTTLALTIAARRVLTFPTATVHYLCAGGGSPPILLFERLEGIVGRMVKEGGRGGGGKKARRATREGAVGRVAFTALGKPQDLPLFVRALIRSHSSPPAANPSTADPSTSSPPPPLVILDSSTNLLSSALRSSILSPTYDETAASLTAYCSLHLRALSRSLSSPVVVLTGCLKSGELALRAGWRQTADVRIELRVAGDDLNGDEGVRREVRLDRHVDKCVEAGETGWSGEGRGGGRRDGGRGEAVFFIGEGGAEGARR